LKIKVLAVRYILGLTTLGDSAASLIKDGELVEAAEKNIFPGKSITPVFLINQFNFVSITPELR